MGRKKKVVEKTVESKVTPTPALGYQGQVKVALVKNNKFYSVKYFKNTGR